MISALSGRSWLALPGSCQNREKVELQRDYSLLSFHGSDSLILLWNAWPMLATDLLLLGQLLTAHGPRSDICEILVLVLYED
jgi:hypothetical protein